MKRRALLVLSLIVVGAALLSPVALAQFHAARLEAGLTAATLDADRLLVALPLENEGPTTALDVRVTRVVLANLPNATPLPISVGDLLPAKSFVLQLQFQATNLKPDRPYHVVVGGTYRIGNGPRQGFEVNARFRYQASDGARPTREGIVNPQQANGAIYPPDPRGFRPDEANEEEPSYPIPEGPLRGTLMPDGAGTDVPVLEPAPDASLSALGGPNTPVQFHRVGTRNVQNNISSLFPWDPSGAAVDVPDGRLPTPLVFLTGNTYMLWSTDGGATFSRVDPTTIFPNNADGGLCCDQVVQYVPSIDRVIWFMQFRRGPGTNTNRIRIASASPQQIINSHATQWTYWDMTSALFNLGNNWMDYPDMSFTNNFLHISIDRVSQGLFVIRAPLTEIRDSQTLHLRYTNPADGAVAYGGHLTQDSPDAAYWFGHASTSSLRIFEWADSSTSYSWRTINVDSWNNSNYATSAPNGVDWLSFGFGRAAIRGATYKGSSGGVKLLTIAWSAGRGSGFAQPYVRLLHLGRFSLLGTVVWGKSEGQIWNSNYAFQHPYLTTNSEGEVGISLGYGGPANHASPIVGFVGDSTLYQVNGSSTTINRWGDYSAIRKHGGNPRLFSVSNYFLQSQADSGVTGGRVVHQYLLFGRAVDVGAAPE